MTTTYHVSDLAALFNAAFLPTENTILCGGYSEPVYLPATNKYPHHRICFTQDYFRSALHEIAHWCVAGKVRRQLLDYGYWYFPDGRDQAQQEAFEAVEVKPQSYEWLLSLSAGHPFEVSLDNLSGTAVPDRFAFTEKVILQTLTLFSDESAQLPDRLATFCQQLQKKYHQPALTRQRVVQEGRRLLDRIDPKRAVHQFKGVLPCNDFVLA
ncbi:elongation factor P hydroxylase [Aliidiomarina taiwanensis]|uniref:Elongation factor P hydroxylase n=1 Tax=Aliidiomarina taiwanensis TaxID=946228 RepID=A0A432X958_9GAMM|nr:elongation factor P hydroxylase [Aliidiomarina taiwanensis]RUO43928.1 elongation factor P hydroxylase [Aliidiomarina taiwanensis]